MGDGVRGQVNIVLESLTAQGEQVLLPLVVGLTSPLSLTTQPNALSPTTGMRLHIYLSNHVGNSGTITMSGTSPTGASITEGPITIPAPVPGQNANVTAWEYETKKVFGTVTSSGIVVTGIGGNLQINGIYAGKFELEADFEFDTYPNMYSPDEFRGTFDKDVETVEQEFITMISKLDADLRPDSTLWFWYLLLNASPTITTIPATPIALLVSGAVTVTPVSLTTQPTKPGMILQFVPTSIGAAGTIVISGTNIYGQAITETINVANGTSAAFFSANVYATVNASGIAYTGMTGGSIAINGIFEWLYEFDANNTKPYTATLEFFDGTDTNSLPFSALEEGTITYEVNKQAMVSGKGVAQLASPIGDRSLASTDSGVNWLAQLGLPTDQPLIGDNSQVWIDPAPSGTPQTTLYKDLIGLKFDVKWPVVPKWTSILSQFFNRIYKKKREATFDATIDFTNLAQYEQMRKGQRQYFAFQLVGPNVQVGSLNAKSVTIICCAKIEKIKRKVGVDQENVEADITARCVYDATLGTAFKVLVACQTNPTYPN